MPNLQLRRGTASQWTTANPVLLAGEVGVETDTSRLKIGDGSTAWNSLPYAPNQPPTVVLTQAGADGDDGPMMSTQVLGGSAPIQTRELFLEATTAMTDSGTLANLGASPNLSRYVALADAATQGCFWTFQIPFDWDGGNIFAQPIWVPGATDAVAHTVRWNYVAKRVIAATDVTAGGTATAWTGASSARTVNLAVFDTSTSIGVAPVVSGGLMTLTVQRVGADAADTYVGVVNLMGVLLTYTSLY